MGSYSVGDTVIYGDKEAKIVKVIIDESYCESPLYLVQDEHQFKYTTDMSSNSSSGVGKAHFHKRQKTSKDSETSLSSTPSARHWSMGEKQKYNIKFHTERSKDSNLKSEFLAFFEVEFPEDVSERLKQLVDLHWDVETNERFDPIQARLIYQSYQFELYHHEALAEDYVRILFEIFDLKATSKKSVRFGKVDLILSKVINCVPFMYCAVVVKAAAPYDIEFREKCRTQLAAYIISMAIDNDRQLYLSNGERFGTQKLYGLLHIGLTPVFYKAQISDEYIDAINLNKHDKLPQLIIHEYAPIEPYTDREILRYGSRSILFKCYEKFKLLMEKV